MVRYGVQPPFRAYGSERSVPDFLKGQYHTFCNSTIEGLRTALKIDGLPDPLNLVHREMWLN